MITENKLSQTLRNGNRKYLGFCIMVAISLLSFCPFFSTSLQGYGLQNVRSTNRTPPTNICLGIHSNNVPSPDIYLLLFHFMEHLQNALLNRHR